MNQLLNNNELVTTYYLYNLGFKFDTTAPKGIIRMKHNKMGDHHISITFTFNIIPEDSRVLKATYGFFQCNDKYNKIVSERHFKDTALTIEEFKSIMLDVYGNEKNIKRVLKHNNIKD